MKYAVLLSCLLIVVYGINREEVGKMKMRILKFGEECQTQTAANAEDINHIILKRAPTRKEGKCLLFCIHKKVGFQEETGKKDISGIDEWVNGIKKLDADIGEKMRQVADKCIQSVPDGDDGCDTAGVLFDCYVKACKELGVPMMVR